MSEVSHYVRFFVAALFCAALIVGDLYFAAFNHLRAGMSLSLVPFRFAASLPGNVWEGVYNYTRSRDALLDEKQRLERRIVEEGAQLQALDFYKRQNRELRRMLDLKRRGEGKWLSAQVERDVSQSGARRIFLDKGLANGVLLGQVVVDESGVVGQVVRANVDTSVVSLLTDAGHWVSTRVERNNLFVILRGDGGRLLTLEYITNDSDIREGDILIADGGLFPPGYPVAVVESLEDGAVYKQGSARLISNFSDNLYALLYIPGEEEEEEGGNAPLPPPQKGEQEQEEE